MSLVSDTHGKVAERLAHIPSTLNPKETAIIILGDAGFNFWLNKSDTKTKREANKYGYTIYCVRGNHEERPEQLNIQRYFDENVNNDIYMESEFPNIKYFVDGEIYKLGCYRTLVIGGAYSIDKYYRLAQAPKNAKWTGWFPHEQLSSKEMTAITEKVKGQWFDFVLTHTCPFSWEPQDLFLSGLNQSTVDNSMEKWMDKLKEQINYTIWLFGHFHDNRVMRKGVEMYYEDITPLEDIYLKWTKYSNLQIYKKTTVLFLLVRLFYFFNTYLGLHYQ